MKLKFVEITKELKEKLKNRKVSIDKDNFWDAFIKAGKNNNKNK